MATKMPFGSAVADVLERRQVEETVATRKWTIEDVEWFENRLHRENVEQDGTFFRDRAAMMAEAFKRSHERGDFLLPEEMTRAQFAAHVSLDLDPVNGQAAPGEIRYSPDEVFDRPEIIAISMRLVDSQMKDVNGPRFVTGEIHDPVMDVVRRANDEGRIMGSPLTIGGVMMEQVRGVAGQNTLRTGRAMFKGETAAARELRLDTFFKNALEAIGLRKALRDFVAQFAGMGKLDPRMLPSMRRTIAEVLAGVPGDAASVGPFARFITEGDEVKQLKEQLGRIDAILGNGGGTTTAASGIATSMGSITLPGE